jgi:hypothetical protein
LKKRGFYLWRKTKRHWRKAKSQLEVLGLASLKLGLGTLNFALQDIPKLPLSEETEH